MNNQRFEFRIGIMAIGALVCLIYLAVEFGKDSLLNFSSEYKIVARFDSAPGLVLRAGVYKSGVKIGRVASIQLVDDDREVEVVMLIQTERKLYNYEECTIKTPTIMGDTTIEFVRKKGFEGEPRVLKQGDPPIRGNVPGDIFNAFTAIEGDMTVAINNVSLAAANLADFMANINDNIIGTPEEIEEKQALFNTTIEEIRRALNSVYALTENVNSIVADPEINAHIRETTCQLPEAIEEGRKLISESQDFLGRMKGTSEKLNDVLGKIDTELDTIDPLIRSLGSDGPAISENLRLSTEKLSGFFDELTSLVQSVNEADGTIKKLLNDPELYESLKTTVANAERLTGELSPAIAEIRPIIRDIKPVVHNAKIFSDKIAREPSAIISGVFRRQPPLKGGLPQWGDGLGSDGLSDADLKMVRAGYRTSVLPDFRDLSPGGRNPVEGYSGRIAEDYPVENHAIEYGTGGYSLEEYDGGEFADGVFADGMYTYHGNYKTEFESPRRWCLASLWPFGKKSDQKSSSLCGKFCKKGKGGPCRDCGREHSAALSAAIASQDEWDEYGEGVMLPEGAIPTGTYGGGEEEWFLDDLVNPMPASPVPVLPSNQPGDTFETFPIPQTPSRKVPKVSVPENTPSLAPVPDFGATQPGRSSSAVEGSQIQARQVRIRQAQVASTPATSITTPSTQSGQTATKPTASGLPQLVFTPESVTR